MCRHRWIAGGRGLKGLVAGLLILCSTAAGAYVPDRADTGTLDRPISSQIDRWTPHIEEASARFGIPEEWIRQVMRAESRGRTTTNGWPITSRAGAMGLMQLMPGTWAEMRAVHGLGPDPHEPRDNILAGTAYLRSMYDRFGYPGLFAAYNAGPARYTEHLAAGRPLPSETVAYVREVAGAGTPASVRAGDAVPLARPPLFASIAVAVASDPGDPMGQAHPLFAIRR